MTMKTMASSPTTCYVIAYDIPEDRRRTKVHKILSGFGTWTQYSLFECFLSKKELIPDFHQNAKYPNLPQLIVGAVEHPKPISRTKA